MAEEEIARSFSPGVTIFVPSAVALFMLNHKRRSIEEIEQRRGVRVYLQADDELTPPEYRLDRIKQLNPGEEVVPRAMEGAPIIEDEPDDLTPEELEAETVEVEAPEETEDQAAAGSQGERERGARRKRRRRGRGGKFRADEFTESEGSEDSPGQSAPPPRPEQAVAPIVALSDNPEDDSDPDEDDDSDDGAQASGREGEETTANGEPRRRRRRGRRGGRRRSRRPDREQSGEAQARPEGWQDRPQSGEAAGLPVPGLGDQPELPELPEQWAQRVAPLTGEASEPAAASAVSEGTTGDGQQAAEPQARRRQRRPRRREEETTAPAAEAIEAPRATHRPVEPAMVQQPAAAVPPVQVIEVGAEQAVADDGAPKRGWWRRLIE